MAIKVTKKQAKRIGNSLKVNWNKVDLEQLRMGIKVESEHASIVGHSLTKFAQIALAHLAEYRDYYTRLKIVESRKRL
jgi:ribosome maturation protein Sdo1